MEELVLKKLKNNHKILLVNDNFYFNPKSKDITF
jgi:hypothetical protein